MRSSLTVTTELSATFRFWSQRRVNVVAIVLIEYAHAPKNDTAIITIPGSLILISSVRSK
jgi:hypothetical protein